MELSAAPALEAMHGLRDELERRVAQSEDFRALMALDRQLALLRSVPPRACEAPRRVQAPPSPPATPLPTPPPARARPVDERAEAGSLLGYELGVMPGEGYAAGRRWWRKFA